MGFLHRRHASNQDLPTLPPPQTNAQGEHISLRQRVSNKVHLHRHDSEGGLFKRKSVEVPQDVEIKRTDQPLVDATFSPYDKFPARPSILVSPVFAAPVVASSPSWGPPMKTELQRPTRPPPPPPSLAPALDDINTMNTMNRPLPPPRPNRSLSSPARPLPTPAAKVESLAIIEPYRYPYGEFPDDSPETDAHVQKVIAGLFR
eukprot:Phypoly_transcript_18965.p1 GENE.Phypoly_transcript_18965~~Phypoly_transcript_18965.p1  ORF type:complete len:226 (+),score=19.70 Phypoly_transcript_18965:71-679(+)